MRSRTVGSIHSTTGVLAALAVLAVGCQTPQRSISEEELFARKAPMLSAAQAEIHRVEASSQLRIEAEYQAARDPGAAPQSHDVLVLVMAAGVNYNGV